MMPSSTDASSRRDETSSVAESAEAATARGEAWFTCDVFDTVITRAFPDPGHVFELIASRLGLTNDESRQIFVDCRAAAEAALRQRLTTGTDLQLAEIYAEVFRRLPAAMTLGLSVSAAMAAEIAAEAECARPWPPGLRLLEEWRRRARFGGFISDMYLPPQAIEDMLRHAGAWKPGDRLFTSGAYRATKASGRLFRVVQETLTIATADWTHLGDHPHADVAVPAALGMRSVQVSAPRSPRRTQAAFSRGQRGLRIAAALNRAAADMPADLDPHRRVVWSIATHVLAPTALWYADRVLRAARRDGRSRLWFLARDGQIVHRAAMIANRSVGFTGELHYVLASRQALHLPSLREFDAEARRWLLANPDIATPDDIAARAGFDEQARLEWLEAVRPYRSPSSAITSAADALWHVLLSAPHRDRVLRSAADTRAAAQTYFRGISPWHGLGIVDIGWGANLQCSLRRILDANDLHGYYLGLFSRNAEVPADAVTPMLFAAGGSSLGTWAAGVSVLECLFAGDHPGVTTYRTDRDGGGGARLHDSATWAPQKHWGVDVLHLAAERAMELLVAEGVVPEADEVEQLLHDVILAPEPDEARALGCWPVQNLQNRSSSEQLARPVNWRDALGRLATGRRLPATMWRAGEAALTGTPQYTVYRCLQRLAAALYE
jgi:FMN phosphatase YigB (HAD superfamily)